MQRERVWLEGRAGKCPSFHLGASFEVAESPSERCSIVGGCSSLAWTFQKMGTRAASTNSAVVVASHEHLGNATPRQPPSMSTKQSPRRPLFGLLERPIKFGTTLLAGGLGRHSQVGAVSPSERNHRCCTYHDGILKRRETPWAFHDMTSNQTSDLRNAGQKPWRGIDAVLAGGGRG